MRPPFEVELWKPVDDTRHILAVTASFEAAEKASSGVICKSVQFSLMSRSGLPLLTMTRPFNECPRGFLFEGRPT
jgi:hypothetical protein